MGFAFFPVAGSFVKLLGTLFKDRPIEDVVEDLRKVLTSFGISEPVVYPASAWQGLLAKLIQRKVATTEHKADFKKFFIARYIEEDEDGEFYVPKMADAAPKALVDSNIPKIEESIIQTVVQNSGWNLLSDTLSKLDKAAKAIEDILNARISGWEIELEELKQKVEMFKIHAQVTQEKVKKIKISIEQQKQILVRGFGQGVSEFAETAKSNIQKEIDKLVEARNAQFNKKSYFPSVQSPKTEINFKQIFVDAVETLGDFVLDMIPNAILKTGIFKISKSLLDMLIVNDTNLIQGTQVNNNTNNQDPYKIKYVDKYEAQKSINIINNFCASHIRSWWTDTEDELVRYGTDIRQKLAQQIQNNIQELSDELSQLLGDSLQVKMNLNPIQFPGFEFSGIDELINVQQEAIWRVSKEKRGGGFCQEAKYVDVQYQDGTQDVYEIDLQRISKTVNQNIDNQVSESKKTLERVIEKQVNADFNNAEQQINEYIERFRNMFDNLIQERETKEGEREKICALLEEQKTRLDEYLPELISIRSSLDNWKPVKND